jgi:hypothetical protein
MNAPDRKHPERQMTFPVSRLFTYTIPIDDGAAPNPFRGMCSLAILISPGPNPMGPPVRPALSPAFRKRLDIRPVKAHNFLVFRIRNTA